jgi:GNAT superfamily N-acetyltransferase
VTLAPEGSPGARPVLVTALEMTDHSDLRPSREPAQPARMVRSIPADPELSRRCYAAVGGPWQWVDRLGWTAEQWRDWVARPGHELWTCEVGSAGEGSDLAGYFELDPEEGGSVQVSYFGLLPGHEGRGLGGWMLTCALRRAWQLPATRRVWLHTCELDGPAALPNYLARGLRAFDTWTEHRLVPDEAARPAGT